MPNAPFVSRVIATISPLGVGLVVGNRRLKRGGGRIRPPLLVVSKYSGNQILALLGVACVLIGMLPAPNVVAAAGVHATATRTSSGKRTPKDQVSFTKAEEVLAFISSYREEKPQRHVPEMVRAMSDLGMLREPEECGIYTGFLAGVISQSGDGAEKLIAAMFPMPPSDQVVLIKAIVYSERNDWRELLMRFVERMPARKVLIDRFLYRDSPGLESLMTEQNGAFAVDVNWGLYFATGNAQPAQRIVAALAWTADRNSVEKLTIGSMAKWTLATNAARDKDLRDIMKAEMNTQPAEVRKPLAEVIEAAETFEVKRIKNDAMKSIEELRQKGPQSARDTVWWGQAGQTALALGCVAASVMGQVEFGIPCVVGGALSSAALKYLAPQR